MMHSALHRAKRQDRGSYGILSSVPGGKEGRVKGHRRDQVYPEMGQLNCELLSSLEENRAV